MDRATVIVALPPVDDRVTKVSSEKVPHLTLLYLGDVQLSSEAILYVQHACAELSPFGLSVDYRGTLGADEADVLFFEKKWDSDRVSDFRHYLLLNDEIKRAYESADQFPEWTPHLTLGYPEAPANDDEEDGRIHYVDFDRIAVWTGDFEGPEFRLKYADIYPSSEMSMSDMTTAERGESAAKALFHYGVKGMRWGVTKVDRATQPTLQREKQTHFLNSKEVTVTQRRAGTFVKTKGGQRQKASDDAVKAHAGRQKAKKSTTDALTNDELKAVVERLRLEQEYAKLDSKVKRKGQNFVTKLLQSPEGRKTTEDLARRIAEANNQ